MRGKTLYDLIGVSRTATTAEIEAACAARAAMYAEDAETGENKALRAAWLEGIERARSTLTDATKRAAYDASLLPVVPVVLAGSVVGDVNYRAVVDAELSNERLISLAKRRKQFIVGLTLSMGIVAIALGAAYIAWQGKIKSDVQNSIKGLFSDCAYLSLAEFSLLESVTKGGQKIAKVTYTLRFSSPQPEAKQLVENLPIEQAALAQRLKALQDSLQQTQNNLAQVQSRYGDISRRNMEMDTYFKQEHAKAEARGMPIATSEKEKLFRESQTVADTEYKLRKSNLTRYIEDYKTQIASLNRQATPQAIKERAREAMYEKVSAECPSIDKNTLRELSAHNKEDGFLANFDARFNKEIALSNPSKTVSASRSTRATTIQTQGKASPGVQQGAALTPEEVYARVSPSVGIVIIFDASRNPIGQGSGVVVGERLMVTNKHVVQRAATPAQIGVLINKVGHSVDSIRCDSRGRDLCLLEISSLNSPAVERGNVDDLAVGHAAFAVGAPKEIQNMLAVYLGSGQLTEFQLTLSPGVVSSLRKGDDGVIIQTSAPISSGSSGGGLFDEHGRLIGITTFKTTGGENLNMALPVTWLADMGI